MSQQPHRVTTFDDSCLEVAVDRYDDLMTHETDVALVVREDERVCMCLDLATARELGELLIKLADEHEPSKDVRHPDDAQQTGLHARVA